MNKTEEESSPELDAKNAIVLAASDIGACLNAIDASLEGSKLLTQLQALNGQMNKIAHQAKLGNFVLEEMHQTHSNLISSRLLLDKMKALNPLISDSVTNLIHKASHDLTHAIELVEQM